MIPELRGFLRLAGETMPGHLASLRIGRDEEIVLQALVHGEDTFLTDGGMTAERLNAAAPDMDVAAIEAVCGEHGARLTDAGWIVRDLHDKDDLSEAVGGVERAIDRLLAVGSVAAEGARNGG